MTAPKQPPEQEVAHEPEKVSVQVAIARIIAELEGVGKTGRNKEQGYNFRGIDAVLQALHPLLGKHGVFFAPRVIERIYEERISARGSSGHCTHLHVEYTVYGPMGDFVTLSTWGEGLDYSDKATNKAMTAAFKYAMFELFAVADPTEDSDATTEDGGVTARPSRRAAPATETTLGGDDGPQYTALQLQVMNHPKMQAMPREQRGEFVTDVIGYANPGLSNLSEEDCEKILSRFNHEPKTVE